MTHDSLHRVIAGDRTGVPRIVEAAWQALTIRFDLAPSGAWHDADRLADDVSLFLDASPRLLDELITAAVDAGQIEDRQRDDRYQIRIITPDRHARDSHHHPSRRAT